MKAEPDPAAGPTPAERVGEALRRIDAEPSGLAKAASVLVLGAVGSWLLWTPLGAPSALVRGVVPIGNCTGFAPASALMYLCSMKVAALTLVGPVALLVLAFVFRRTLTALVGRLRGRLPAEAQFLPTPLVATGLFATSWAGVHFDTGAQNGLLPQTLFPGLIGLFTFGVARWGPAIQSAARPFFDRRDRFPMRARVAAAIVLPLAVSLVITAEQRVSNTAFKEQLVVLIGLVSGFLVLAPRRGDLIGGVTSQVASLRRRG